MSKNSFCAISHIGLQENDDIVLLLIYKSQRKFIFENGPKFDRKSIPFTFPIFGKYKDGAIKDIKRDENIQWVEKYFNIPIEDILSIALSENKNPYEKRNAEYMLEKPEWINNKIIPLNKFAPVLGYQIKDENKFGPILENKYAKVYFIDKENLSIKFKNETMAKERLGTFYTRIKMNNINTANQWLLNIHYGLSGKYIGIKNDIKTDILMNMSGIFILKDIANSLVDLNDIKKTYENEKGLIETSQRQKAKLLQLYKGHAELTEKSKDCIRFLKENFYVSNACCRYFDQFLFLDMYGDYIYDNYLIKMLAIYDSMIKGMIETNTMILGIPYDPSDYKIEKEFKLHSLACSILKKKLEQV